VSSRRSRGVSSVVGVVLLTALAVGLAAAVGAAALSLDPGTPPATVALAADAEAGTDRVSLVHRGGDALSVAALRGEIAGAGEPLRYQPPVPFVGARGFRGAPAGPFNAVDDGRWTAGERASVRIAATNDPTLSPGAAVRIRVWADDAPVADLTATA
jgi:FlaG/FlaF family flagellin (archaellin)